MATVPSFGASARTAPGGWSCEPVEAPDGEASGVYRVSDIRGWKPGKESYVASFAAVDGSVEGGSGG